MKILFLHGWQSVPGGVKPTFLGRHGHEVINPKLPDEDFSEAVKIAQAEFDRHHPAVVVGSSRGGAVALNINSGDARLVLLCPAWKKFGTARTAKPGTVILHSRADDVVLFAHSEELVKNSGLTASALIEVGSDHRLADPEPLAAMLQACNGAASVRELLAARIRSVLARKKNIEEKKMFGGVGFLLKGNLLVGVWKGSLIVRLGPEAAADARLEPHVKEFDITGRPMKGWVMVEPEGIQENEHLSVWIRRAVKFVGKLPAK
jgi:TfoX/Sxy family transcriptional regulator of competence genes